MKTRLLAIGLACISAALVACGGGGGGGGPTPPTPTSTPVTTPTPYALGDSMTFSGSRVTAASFSYPSPSPYPATSATDSLTQTVAVSASPNPFGSLTAGDFHTVETDVAALVTHTTTTDAWIGISGSDLVEYGYKSADDSGDSMSVQPAAPAILDQNPETNGASWTNGAGATYTEKEADGTATSLTYNANGTYSETTTNTGTRVNTTIVENADGSGSLSANGSYLGGNVDNIVFSAPAANQVTVTVNYVQPPQPTAAPSGQPSPTPAPTIAPLVYTAPAWYGSGTPSFYSQVTTVTTGAAYPVSCSVPSAYGTSGGKLVQTTTRLDAILGYTDTQTQTTYTNAQYGPVCVIVSDVQNEYYDYQDDFAAANGFHFHFPGTPLSTTTIAQTLTLGTGAVVHLSPRSNQSQTRSSISMARVASATAALALHALRTRHRRQLELIHYFATHARKEIR